jgi:transcriptional regulator with XRE-family HTH domain
LPPARKETIAVTTERFGERVRERRIKEGLSQADLAEQVGISRTYLSEIERGLATNLSWRVVENLTTELGLSVTPELDAEQRLENLPPGLAEFAASREDVSEQDTVMLASLKFRGKQPTTPEAWALVYNAIEVATRSST